ncbi:hypothetical protein BJ508DRAFT_304867 [Ascobolus immersus RN42]|uniref:Uncharacterized protein n=1 Tax=Ascobolus immersus RN42 TaxID=1160509 RepID=A0A3N4IG27_ASCIM|nr:hypothetical protein BJ508DRAFT_304867 [Ascobolus immersus RN42]
MSNNDHSDYRRRRFENQTPNYNQLSQAAQQIVYDSSGLQNNTQQHYQNNTQQHHTTQGGTLYPSAHHNVALSNHYPQHHTLSPQASTPQQFPQQTSLQPQTSLPPQDPRMSQWRNALEREGFIQHANIYANPTQLEPLLSIPMANADFNDLLENVPGMNDLWEKINASLDSDSSMLEGQNQARVPTNIVPSQREIAEIRAAREANQTVAVDALRKELAQLEADLVGIRKVEKASEMHVQVGYGALAVSRNGSGREKLEKMLSKEFDVLKEAAENRAVRESQVLEIKKAIRRQLHYRA